MNAINLPKAWEAWAEVAAGRAESVEGLVARATADYQRQMEAFRASLDAASEDARAGNVIPLEVVFRELEAMYSDEP